MRFILAHKQSAPLPAGINETMHTHRSSCSLAIATEIPVLISAKHGTCMSLHEHQYIQCVVKTVYTVDSSIQGCNMILLPQHYYPLPVHMHSEGYSTVPSAKTVDFPLLHSLANIKLSQ